MIGHQIHNLARQLWPINRSITGNGVRKTLEILRGHLPNLMVFEVPTGTKVFDWVVPKEWRIKEAWIRKPNGEKICDFSKNNLHIVGYSIPVHKKMTLAELSKSIYSLPNQPKAIPYITFYYREGWGFCLSEDERVKLVEGEYEVFVDAELFDGALTYGELIIPGSSNDEVFISTYICHPSMANNELSGPTVTTYLAKWVSSLSNRRLTYRFVFIPETIGSISYLSRNINILKERVIAGFNVSCVGDDRAYSYLPSRNGNTVSDHAAKHVLKWIDDSYKVYTWADRGSDERQYCAPNIDLPIASIMRTKYGKYDEYHTSLDDLANVVTPQGLEGGYTALRLALEALERNCYPAVKVLGEPQLGKRGLRPTLTTNLEALPNDARIMSDLITWSDGRHSLLEIAELCDVPIWDLYPITEKLSKYGLLDLSSFEAPE